MTTRQTPDAVRKLHVALLDCPHCGSRPERRTRRKQKVVRCHAGSHLLEAIADSQREADDIWNTMAADWARKNTREGQAAASIQVLNAIANIQHIAGVVVNGSLNTHAHQLRECARILSAALDSRAGDAGEEDGVPKGMKRAYVRCRAHDRVAHYDYVPYSFSTAVAVMPCGCDTKHAEQITREQFIAATPAQTGGKPGWDEDGICNDHGRELCSDCARVPTSPAPAVDAVPAGEVEQ